MYFEDLFHTSVILALQHVHNLLEKTKFSNSYDNFWSEWILIRATIACKESTKWIQTSYCLP